MEVIFENIPNELREGQAWVVWNRVNRGGKPTKVPFQTNKNPAKSNDPTTWDTFANIKSHYESFKVDGVGRVITDDFIGIDLDNCIEDSYGTLAEWAQEIVDILPETYIEISPSNTGVKLWIRGNYPQNARSKKGGYPLQGAVEVYPAKGRYFTITGQTLGDCQSVANVDDTTIAKLISHCGLEPVARPEPKPKPKPLKIVDDEFQVRYDAMMDSKSAPQIEALMSGDITGHNNDNSSADMALCNFLAFWFAGNEDWMDRVFRSSQLIREKWDQKRRADGATYGQMTIEEAVSNCDAFYEVFDHSCDITLSSEFESQLRGEHDDDGLPPAIEATDPSLTTSDDEWGPMLPLIEESPDLDISSILPDTPLQSICEDIHKVVGTPHSYNCSAALSAVSIAMTGSYTISNAKGFEQPPMLYFVGIGPSGVNKTYPFARALFTPLNQWEQLKKKDKNRHDREQEFIKKHKVLQKIKNDIIKMEIDGANTDEKEEMKARVEVDIEQLGNVHPPTILADDATTEGLAVLWCKNNGVISLASDESNILQDVIGRYSKVSNLKPYLNGYDGIAPLKQTRANEELSREVDNASCNIFCVAQPEIMNAFFKERELVTSGFFARTIFCSPRWPLRTEIDIANREGADASADIAWQALLHEILDFARPNGLARQDSKTVLRLSQDAHELWAKQAHRIDYEMDFGGLGSGDMRPWSAKMAARIMRLAGVLHVIKNGPSNDNLIISKDTMMAASELGWHYAKHAENVFVSAGAAGLEIDAIDLWEKIKIDCLEDKKDDKKDRVNESGEIVIPVRDIHQRNRGRWPVKQEFMELLGFLQTKNHLKVFASARIGGGRPKEYVKVNPNALSQ